MVLRCNRQTRISQKRNEKDLEDLPDEVRNTLIFVTVDRIDEAFKVMFVTDQNGEETTNFSFTVNRSSV